MCLRQVIVPFAMAAGLVGVATDAARGEFGIVAHAATADAASRRTTFTVDFTEIPDFFTTLGGEVGLERHAFQVFVDADPLDDGDVFSAADVFVVRGPEIRVDPDGLLRVRDTVGFDPDPDSGGWGDVRGRVPWELDGTTVSFDLPWDLVDEADGSFAYVVESYEFGNLTDSFDSRAAAVVPLPAGAWTGISVLAGLGVAQRIGSRRRAG